MNLQDVCCPCCSSPDARQVALAVPHNERIPGKYSIVECNNCGLGYLNPRLDDPSLAACYQVLNDYPITVDYTVPQGGGLVRKLWRSLNGAAPIVDLIRGGPVLDVGCNRGELMAEISGHGYEVHGVEFSAAAVEDCRRKGLQVTQCDVRDMQLPPAFYRTIVASHVLEHLPDPVGTLSKFRDALAPDGRIIIYVPNRRSPMVPVFRSSWHGWDPPFHLTHFDKRSLRECCARAQLRVVNLNTIGSSEDLTRSLWIKTRRRKRHLAVRILLWPLFAIAGKVGHGSCLLLVAEKAANARHTSGAAASTSD